jgi:hypothetical protein
MKLQLDTWKDAFDRIMKIIPPMKISHVTL